MNFGSKSDLVGVGVTWVTAQWVSLESEGIRFKPHWIQPCYKTAGDLPVNLAII